MEIFRVPEESDLVAAIIPTSVPFGIGIGDVLKGDGLLWRCGGAIRRRSNRLAASKSTACPPKVDVEGYMLIRLTHTPTRAR